jgi:hypothetical protein
VALWPNTPDDEVFVAALAVKLHLEMLRRPVLALTHKREHGQWCRTVCGTVAQDVEPMSSYEREHGQWCRTVCGTVAQM